MSKFEYKEFYRTNLPHYQPEGGIFAVSFRLAFNLPESIIESLKADKSEYEIISSTLTDSEKGRYDLEFKRNYFADFDRFLAKYQDSPDWLKNYKIADCVQDSFIFLNQKKYILHCYTIMPNHVHLIIEPVMKNNSYYAVSEILQSLKGYTARECNKILNRKGQFWQHGHYDHMIRDDNDYNYQVEYVKNNPVKAGFVKIWENWRYTFVKQSYIK